MLRRILARLLWGQTARVFDDCIGVMRDINAGLVRMNETLETMTGVMIEMHEGADEAFSDDPETDVGLS